MSNRSQAWASYERGNYRRALQLFDQVSDGDEQVIGKALCLVGMGRGEEAIPVINQRLHGSPSPQMRALFADVKGRQSARAEAERILSNLITNDPDDGFFYTLLGEQRIRQAKWDGGTEAFVQGLNKPRDKRAIAHMQRVVADMIDAVAARRIPTEDASKFVNRLDYSMADKPDELSRFFGAARRALNNNNRLDRQKIREFWSISEGNNAPTARAPSTPPRPSQGAPQGPPTSSSPPPPGQSKQSQKPSGASRRREELQNRLSERPQQAEPDAGEQLIEADKKDMTAVMQRERGRNEDLQDLVASVSPPIWPSDLQEPIDVIDAIGFSDEPVIRGSTDIETDNFRITGGEISVEITLERCMHNLIAAAQAVKATAIPLTLQSIPRLELNLLDDFLDQMPEIDKLYRDEAEVEHPRALAVGKFLGECIVQSYGGQWNYAVPARDSVILLGDHTLDPIGLARDFFDADDFDAVDFTELIDDAEVAVYTSTDMPVFSDYIDPTSGVVEDALMVNLAELWVGYRFAMDDTDLQPVASSIRLLEETPRFVTFSLPSHFLPDLLTRIPGAVGEDGRAWMDYIRDSGEFLLLGSRKHFCRLLEVVDVELSRDTGSRFANWLRRFFRPGWDVIADSEAARRSGADVDAPRLRKESGAVELRVDAVDSHGGVRQIELSYQPRSASPYQVTVR